MIISRSRATSSSAPRRCRILTIWCWSGSASPDFDRMLEKTINATYPEASGTGSAATSAG